VNVTEAVYVPALGAVEGVVKANVPGTDATPPLRVEEARVCPYVIGLAVGGVVIVGVALPTLTLTEVPAVL
jgi:hypothetical protein